jgi:hypothetical protein
MEDLNDFVDLDLEMLMCAIHGDGDGLIDPLPLAREVLHELHPAALHRGLESRVVGMRNLEREGVAEKTGSEYQMLPPYPIY